MITSVSLANLLNEYHFKFANVPRSELVGRPIARAQGDKREGAELQNRRPSYYSLEVGTASAVSKESYLGDHAHQL